jgi:hypothetical protein
MSNLLTPVELHVLEAVTGGTTTTPMCSGTGSDSLLQQLTTLSSTLKDVSTTAKSSGFSTTEVLMLGLMMNQNRQVNVFVRRPYW